MLISTQVAGSAASFAASSFMTTAIVKSDGGLTRPYSRILLGLSVSDMVQSVCLMFGPLLVPKTTPLGHWAIGNSLTCTVSGTPIIISMISIPLYYVALCLYTICKVKRNMTDAVFAETVEKYMHYFIILFSVIPAIISIATKSTNSTVLGSFCSYAAYPTGCRQAPQIFGECDPSAGVVRVLVAIYAGAVPVACFFGIVIIMAIICWHVITRDRIFGSPPASGSTTSSLSIRRTQGSDGLRNNGGSSSSSFPVSLETGSSLKPSDLSNSQLTSENESFKYESVRESVVPDGEVADRSLEQGTLRLKSSADPTSLTLQDESSKKFVSGSTAFTVNEHRVRRTLPGNQCSVGTRESLRSGIQDPTHQQETDTIRRTIRREIFLQAFWFVAAFFCTFVFFHTLQLKLIFGYTPSNIHYQVGSFLFPVGGVFNVLVYTRPKISNLRIRQPQLSRLKAFWIVVKAGGVIPNTEPNEIRPWNRERNIIDSINHQAKPGVYAKQAVDDLSIVPMHLVSSEPSRSANNSLIRPHKNGRDTNLKIDSAGASLEVLQEVQSSDEERFDDCEEGKESVQSSDDVMGPLSYSQITSNSHALSGFEDGSIMDPISYSQITSNSHALSRDEDSSIEGPDAEGEDIVQNAYARAMERIDQLKTK